MISLQCSCYSCKNFINGTVCKAFSEKIPDEIIAGIDDHTQHYPGDNGIQYEPIETEEKKE